MSRYPRDALVAGLLLTNAACVTPANVLVPTRTPRAGKVAAGAALEYSVLAQHVGTPSYDTAPFRHSEPSLHVRPRVWASYGLTDRIALSYTSYPFPLMFGGQAGVQGNVFRSRYLDFSLLGRLGYERCEDGAWQYMGDNSGMCSDGVGVGRSWYGHGSALGLVGFNPFSWLTFQAQGGIWVQKGFDWRANAWLGGNMYVLLGKVIGVGPDIAFLPRWFPDGRHLIQPALSIVFFPQRGGNPYRDP